MATKPDWMEVERHVTFSEDGELERKLHVVLDADGVRFMRAIMASAVYEMELAGAKNDAWQTRSGMVELFNHEVWQRGGGRNDD